MHLSRDLISAFQSTFDFGLITAVGLRHIPHEFHLCVFKILFKPSIYMAVHNPGLLTYCMMQSEHLLKEVSFNEKLSVVDLDQGQYHDMTAYAAGVIMVRANKFLKSNS